MIIPAPNPVAFCMFSFPVYWYGIIMAVGIFLAVLVGNRLFNSVCPEKKDFVINIAPIVILAGIVGARLYFCLLNSAYLKNPIEILNIRQGGLSIHGALIFGISTLVICAKYKKISPLKILDALSCATFLGQAIGRWGNYFNSEAFGLPVLSQNWGLFIPLEKRPYEYANFSLFHPTFLYESLLDLFGFVILLFCISKFGKKYSGITFFGYLILYSVIRFFVEQVRVDSALNIGTIPIAQIISVVIFLVGLVGLVFCAFKNLKSGEKF